MKNLYLCTAKLWFGIYVENHILKTICDKRCKKIGELRRERKELATLAQLIHKITDGKLENVESIVGMMDIEQQTISDEQ